jgi:hypothetical protein
MSSWVNAGIAVIGIDIGKNSFHVVGHDKRGAIGHRPDRNPAALQGPAVSYGVSFGRAGAAPRLDSERFRFAPRTCRPPCAPSLWSLAKVPPLRRLTFCLMRNHRRNRIAEAG